MQAIEFVGSYIDAWNHQDSHAVAEHLAENGTYLDIPVHQHMSRAQLIAHLDEQFELESYLYELTGEVLLGRQTIAFQYKALPRGVGTQSGRLEAWHGAEFLTMQSGTAVEIVDYYEQRGVVSPASPLSDTNRGSQVKRYAKSGLSGKQMEAVKQQLSHLMETEKAYLQPDITLPHLARELGCTVNHVSQAINAGFGMTFFDYLNRYRVLEAMALLCPENNEARTVLSVALQVGFNSTSTFYVAFKKVTGRTPAQYRRQASSKPLLQPGADHECL